jgi:hypothetical protein
MSWLRNALHKTTKPEQSIIGKLRHGLGGSRPGRSMEVLHASDVTKIDFCPRRWAFYDLLEKKPDPDLVPMALDVTFRMGNATEQLLIEEWAGSFVIGNWQCRYCGEQRSMTINPGGWCGGGKAHWWRYVQTVVDSQEYGIQGGIDALFNIGLPQLVVTEIKTINPVEFDAMLVPLPEHRLRTNLYLWILENSKHPHREKINTQEGRVLYISRGFGKLNTEWNEILPFREFVVKRNDADLAEFLTRAQLLKTFRDHRVMPTGICATAVDKFAKKCSVCAQCFSGKYVAGETVEA